MRRIITFFILAILLVLSVTVLIHQNRGFVAENEPTQTIKFPDGKKYVGQITGGQPDGHGRLYGSKGEVRYEGQWKGGKPYGWGNWYNPNGSIRQRRERLEPEQSCYFGVNIDPAYDSVSDLTSRLGLDPTTYVTFVEFPLNQRVISDLNSFMNKVVPTGGIALITLLPVSGLDTVTAESSTELANLCADYEKLGINVMIRFAHEMNGSWYPWGQQPITYKEKFRILADEVHSRTQNTAMLWAPNSGGGYPFSGGHYEVRPGTPDFGQLDTNKDNILNMDDDMYSPYYPGDDAVDWVGMTVYHWGNNYPWFENELPEAKSFTNHITGNYNGLGGDQRAVPDFYAMFCQDGTHNKPMAVPETAALYNTEQLGKGASEFDIKQVWWQQVFNVTGDTPNSLNIRQHFPKIKMINWFDVLKKESEVQNNLLDWRISKDQAIRQAFLNYLRPLGTSNYYFTTAQEYRDRLWWDKSVLEDKF